MDDLSRTSDAAAAATRKRRSSILKSQRPPRTPFSELEFNVATPTDTAKSRRVSFSRRTGVAEFITNEATTTWKNFYEEHNKSLESSGNESAANAPRPIGHIGKRIFDQQFQEVEAVDFGSTLDSHNRINTSINNVNFTQQLASLECTGDDRKLSIPQQNFEMSALTDHQSKVFGDDLAISTMGEMSGRIDINFSAVQNIGEVKDDLDEIQNDLQRAQSNIVCPGPFSGRRSLSEYIEVDLNATHVTVKNDDDDMSITDTIHSPKVQDVSKNLSSVQVDKKASLNKDWVADKENIALNPYVTPKESTNFAINDDSDKILVFDGKRLTIQSDKEAEKILKSSTSDVKPAVKEPKAHQRKTIVLNTNDDLPNFIDDAHMSSSNGLLSSMSFKHSVMYDDDDELTNENRFLERQKSIQGNDTGNISTTQGIPNNIILSEQVPKQLESSRTVVFDNMQADISMTQVLPSKIIGGQEKIPEPQRRRTILYENETGDISITQAMPANIIVNEAQQNVIQKTESERRRTILYDNDMGNVSVTQAMPGNILINENKELQPGRRRTILYDNDMGNISMTQAIPANIILDNKKEGSLPETERRRTIIYDNDTNISMTQAIPANILINEQREIDNQILQPEKRRTIMYDNDMEISMTRPIPASIILNENKESNKPNPEKRRSILYSNDLEHISMTQGIPPNIIVSEKEDVDKSKTLLYESIGGDISMTQAIPTNLLIDNNRNPEITKRRTIVFENEDCDISVTKALPSKIILPEQTNAERRRTIIYDNDSVGNISITQAIPANIIYNEHSKVENEPNKSMVGDVTHNVSRNQTIPTKLVLPVEDKISTVESSTDTRDIYIARALTENVIIPNENRKTIVFKDEAGNISVTRTMPNIFGTEKEVSNKSPQDQKKIIASVSDTGDISISGAIANTTLANEKLKTVVYEDEAGNISVTRTIPANILEVEKHELVEKRKTILYESNAPDLSVKQAVLVNVLIVNNATEKRKSIVYNAQTENSNTTKSTLEEGKTENESKCASDVQIEPLRETSVISAENNLKDDVSNKSENSIKPTDSVQDKTNSLYNNATSSDGLIYIIRDTEDETQTDKVDDHKPNKSLKWKEDVSRIQNTPLSLEYKEEIDEEVSVNIPKKLNELKTAVGEKINNFNRQYESIINSDVDIDKSHDKSAVDKLDISKGAKSFKDANDTNELLEMLSDLTDKRHSTEPEKPLEKIECNEPRRLSVVPSRQSIVLSREDLLNNISMAQAALQRSVEIDESIDDTTSDTPLDSDLPTKKATRVSNEVVKKLQFEEDESASDASIKSEFKGTPLKKTAFGETSYMKENKAKVIPSYLKDVSDEIKALMSDLVKPNVDAGTFQIPPADKSLKRDPSTCSTQIQANLITSSQIDLETEMTSETDSGFDIAKESNPSAFSVDCRSPGILAKSSEDCTHEVSFRPKREAPCQPPQERVILFDHHNPLNNILLVPIDFSEVHKYDPPKSNETICADSPSMDSAKENSPEMRNTQFVGNVTISRTYPSGDTVPDKSDAQSLLSNSSKPISIDESVSVRVCELKDIKVNTMIAMKGNKELLEASSSLTLVDDALAHGAFDVDLDMVTAASSSTNAQGNPIKLIYQNEEKDNMLSEKAESDITSTDDIGEHVTIANKPKKRIYSPTKKEKEYNALTSLDVTPKPILKMQKLSFSPKYKEDSPEKLTAEKDEDVRSKSAMDVDDSSDNKSTPKERKRSPRKSPKSKKPGTSVTVQQLLTKYDIQADIDQEALNKQIIQALSRSDSSTAPNTDREPSFTDVQIKSPDIVSSFTSSKNQNEMREANSVTNSESITLSSKSPSAKMDWQPDSINETSSRIVSECESSVNVVAKIDMLPFMGHECEWEASGIDTWSFRLLHGRLRLSVRLAHRHDNATRTRVRADTPVRHVALDTAHQDKKNSVANLCVGFALEAMRYFVVRGCTKAGDVPGLLRRCAGVARVALRWGRAMHEARLHLAYSLGPDGRLALKVANIPLRSVWEVTMRLELVVEDAREVPWPRAGNVRVARVVSDVRVRDDEVQRALAHLPRDWGHAPRTVWKIFRYLKNKTREEEVTGL